MEDPPLSEGRQNESADCDTELLVVRGEAAFFKLVQPPVIDDAGPLQRAISVEPRLFVRDLLAQPAEQPVEIGEGQIGRLFVVRLTIPRAVPRIERPQ